MIKRILVGVCDPLYTASASRYALELGERFGAEVTAIAVTDIERLKNIGPVAIGARGLAEEIAKERIDSNEMSIRESLDILVRRLEEARVPCKIIKEAGAPYHAMIDASRYQDLMIFGLRGLFEHGVVDEPPDELVKLIESGVRPILAVGPDFRETKRILIALSDSIESATTMRHFANLNLWPDALLKVVHFAKRGSDGPALLTEARHYLEDHGFNVETECVEGSSKSQLLEHADSWKADLIVVGNSAKSLLRRRVFGETALRLMQESKMPLFLSQ